MRMRLSRSLALSLSRSLLRNWLGAEGARLVADALMVNTSLTELGLRSCRIGAEGGRALGEALTINGAPACVVVVHGHGPAVRGGWPRAKLIGPGLTCALPRRVRPAPPNQTRRPRRV